MKAFKAVSFRMMIGLGVASFALAPSLGCTPPPPKSVLTYSEDAKKAYDDALEDFTAHNWLESQALFRELKRKYVYSRYARLAELRIADADFEQEKYGEATRGFRQFIREHRTETEEIGYARAKIAEAQYREIGDAFLLPSADEREQTSVKEAYLELRSFLRDYPEAKEVKHIRELLADVVARLMRHELLVAKFYLGKDNLDAAALRIKFAIASYGTSDDPIDVPSGTEADAWLLLGETYLRMHKWVDARASFTQIVKHHKSSDRVQQAQRYLDRFGKDIPSDDPQKPAPQAQVN
jgi:outer membrane protein assembly factor BamD